MASWNFISFRCLYFLVMRDCLEHITYTKDDLTSTHKSCYISRQLTSTHKSCICASLLYCTVVPVRYKQWFEKVCYYLVKHWRSQVYRPKSHRSGKFLKGRLAGTLILPNSMNLLLFTSYRYPAYYFIIHMTTYILFSAFRPDRRNLPIFLGESFLEVGFKNNFILSICQYWPLISVALISIKFWCFVNQPFYIRRLRFATYIIINLAQIWIS